MVRRPPRPPLSKRSRERPMSKKTIIILKKARAHGGHHGGAWKVAYADFVTAMMALFIVLWLMNTSDHVRKVIAGYFNDPRGRASLTGTDRAGSDDKQPLIKENAQQLKERLEKAILQTEQFKSLSNQIEIRITPEGASSSSNQRTGRFLTPVARS